MWKYKIGQKVRVKNNLSGVVLSYRSCGLNSFMETLEGKVETIHVKHGHTTKHGPTYRLKNGSSYTWNEEYENYNRRARRGAYAHKEGVLQRTLFKGLRAYIIAGLYNTI